MFLRSLSDINVDTTVGTTIGPAPVSMSSVDGAARPSRSRLSRRTRSLRAWMLMLPIDGLAVLAPIAWSTRYWKGIAFTAALTVTLFAVGGLYRARRHLSILDELPSLCGRLLTAAAVVGAVAAQRHDSVGYAGGLMRTVGVAAVLVLLGRAATCSAVLLARRRGWVERNAVVIGCGPVAQELARLLQRYPQCGLRFAGFVDASSALVLAAGSTALAGDLADLDAIIDRLACEVLIVADPVADEPLLLTALREPGALACDLWLVPRLRELHPSRGGGSDHIGAIPVVHVRRPTLTGVRWLVKRLSDVVLASVALALASPVMALCALAVRIEGGPGVLYRQQRIGRHGRSFDLIKFRSLRPASEEEARTTWSVAGDPRVGPVGRFLRRTSLDELPQLWNVLRGDMTIVGPRPERPHFVDQFSARHPAYAMRHRVPVGLTGLAQVSGLRGDTSVSDRARFDNYYIERWSLWLDVKVMLRTFGEVLRGRGR